MRDGLLPDSDKICLTAVLASCKYNREGIIRMPPKTSCLKACPSGTTRVCYCRKKSSYRSASTKKKHQEVRLLQEALQKLDTEMHEFERQLQKFYDKAHDPKVDNNEQFAKIYRTMIKQQLLYMAHIAPFVAHAVEQMLDKENRDRLPDPMKRFTWIAEQYQGTGGRALSSLTCVPRSVMKICLRHYVRKSKK